MKRVFRYIGAILGILAIVFSASPAYAATTSSGLSITPRKDYVVDPGKSVTDKLTIGNLDTKLDLNISLKVIDFTFNDQSGTPKLMLAANAPQTSWSLKPFISLPASILIPAGATRTVDFTVTVPANQGAGSYYSAIEYAATGVNGGNVSLSASGVTLAFLSVPGIVNENMVLQKFGAYQPDTAAVGGGFLYIATKNGTPSEIAYTLKNDGNVAEDPAGSIVIKNIFGHITQSINNANPNSSLALIGQTRRFEACIKPNEKKVQVANTTAVDTSCTDPHLFPGRYTANLDVFYGQNGNKTREITSSAHFWYLPWWFIAAVIGAVLLLVFVIWWIVRKVRKLVGGKTQRRRR